MNFDELVQAQENSAALREQTPLGVVYRKQNDRKFRHFLELKPDLADSLVFCEALRRDQQQTLAIADAHQLHYELHEDSGGIFELELEMGNFQTLTQLLKQNPAVVAQKGFIANTLQSVMAFLEQLHAQGIYHLCLAPSTVFMRKSDNSPLLLCHGSSFLKMKNPSLLYNGFEKYVAPEVMAGGNADERSDVYALGRFVEQLYDSAQMPLEYKALVKKATADDPDARYSSVAEMRHALSKHQDTKHTLLIALAALAVVGLLIWAYFDLVPKPTTIEFVDSNGLVEKPDPFSIEYEYDEDDSGLDNGFDDPAVAYFLDSLRLDELNEEEELPLDSAHAASKAEEIFVRRFTRQAQSLLSKLYVKEQMGANETQFVSKSHEVVEELMNYAQELGKEAGMAPDAASTAALSIITRLQSQLMKDMDEEEE